MKHIAMKHLALALAFAISAFSGVASYSQTVDQPGQACGEKLRAVVDGEKVSVNITRSTYRLAGQALRHYRAEIASEFEVYIEEAAEYRSQDGKLMGFKISITDGGDESMVDYILDHRRKLVSAYWHNQSPVRFWFCK